MLKWFICIFCLIKLPEFVCTNSCPSIDSQSNLYEKQSSKTPVKEE
jgi:hypothetical protein